jgi:Uma2 family endonuclease
MAAGTLISVDEYLRTSYSPDREYVDGELVEMHVGDWLHSLVQSNLIFALRTKYPHLKVVPELRSKVTATRYRLPDVSVLLEPPSGRVLTAPALIAIEIISEDDTVSRLLEKLNEYEALGTPNIWTFDPRTHEMFTFRKRALTMVTGDTISTTDGAIQLTREEIFRD